VKLVVTARIYPGQPPFSILKRIVMGETVAFVCVAGKGEVFQYPQADRDG